MAADHDEVEAPATGPALAVVLPVYNAMPYFPAAIESILSQSLPDFEFCIYDDHSTDGSFECARAWAVKDPRIRVTRGSRRLGPAGSSAAAMAMTRAELVARMDADDIAHRERLELQFNFLRAHPHAIMIASTYRLVDSKGRLFSMASSDRMLADRVPFAHASIMVRRPAFEASGGYRDGTDYFEDVDLYERMRQVGPCYVLRRPLMDLRYAGQHARLTDDPALVLRYLDRQRGLTQAEGDQPRYSANSIRSLAALRVLNLERPRLLALILKTVRHAPLSHFIRPAVFVGFAEISPRLTRALLQLRWRLSERRMSRTLPDQDVFLWEPDKARVQPVSARRG